MLENPFERPRSSSPPLRLVSSPVDGADELRRVVRHLDGCAGDRLDGVPAWHLVALCRAVWACGWDVWIDDMSDRQWAAVLSPGEIPRFAEGARGLVPMPTRVEREAWRDWDPTTEPTMAACYVIAWLAPHGREDLRLLDALRAALEVTS